MSNVWVNCYTCSGRGELSCRNCYSGYINCPSCMGSGSYSDGSRCNLCGGSKQIRCNICGGSGYQRCPSCGGSKGKYEYR